MFYRASDPSFSTQDWFRINTSSIPQSLVIGEDSERFEDCTEIQNEDAVEVPEWNVEPNEEDEQFGIKLFTEPDREDYADAGAGLDEDGNSILNEIQEQQYAEDLASWKDYDEKAREAINDRENSSPMPMWGTFFNVEDHPKIRENCFKVGLRLYEHPQVDGLLIGVDSCGHSFFDSYWIQLRALFAAEQLRYSSRGDAQSLYDLLLTEWKREGGTYAKEQLDRILGPFMSGQAQTEETA
jgi:hypothetical protein